MNWDDAAEVYANLGWPMEGRGGKIANIAEIQH
jgi:hypothetical protein